jgi:hypothetical protein
MFPQMDSEFGFVVKRPQKKNYFPKLDHQSDHSIDLKGTEVIIRVNLAKVCAHIGLSMCSISITGKLVRNAHSRAVCIAQVVECLSSKLEALSSNPSKGWEKKEKGGKERGKKE